jgi:penicillin-binding protein 1C
MKRWFSLRVDWRRALALGGAGGVAGFLVLCCVPLPASLDAPPPASLVLTDREGRPLRETRSGEAFGKPVPLARIPPLVQHAFLAAEDKRFYSHRGVDGIATARAARDGLRKGRIVSGASTISQQLIKIAEPRPRTWRTKIIEAASALRLELAWSKARILEEYLNRVDLGNLNFGAAAAADFYFGKPLADLTPAEAALIAGLPKNPTRLNPHRAIDRARARQRTVLRRMLANGWLDQRAFERALAEPAMVRPPRRVFRAPHFVDLVLREADATARTARTTLDLGLQEFVEARLGEQMRELRSKSVSNGAVVVIENATGGVLALAGSEDYFSPAAGQVNAAWMPRSAGSTLKPFTYLPTLEGGATAATVLADIPTEFTTAAGTYRVENYQRQFSGPVSLRQALACSLNVPAVQTLDEIGGPGVLQRRLKSFGFTTIERPAAEYGLGLAIGNAGVRLLELTNAYAGLARMGQMRPWSLFADEAARLSWQAAEPRACWVLADILADNAARAPAFGLHSPLRCEFPVAAKTGTSTDYRDNWSIGYTPEFTVGVWVGNFDGSPMREVSGVSGAAPLMRAVFHHLKARHRITWFSTPPDVIEAHVEPLTGHRVSQPTAFSRREKFLAEHLPPEESPLDFDAEGRIRLPARYAAWLAGAGRALAHRAAACAARGHLRIAQPAPGTVFVIDPDLPGSAHARLIAEGAAGVRWESASLDISTDADGARALLRPGEHQIGAIDPATGHRIETWVRVKEL